MYDAQAPRGLPALVVDIAAYYILISILNTPLHGLGIFEEVAHRTNNRLILIPATLYAMLKRMDRDGWIEQVEPELAGARRDERRKFFRATPLGRQQVAEWLAWMEEELPRTRTALTQAARSADGETGLSRDPPEEDAPGANQLASTSEPGQQM